MVSSEPSGRVHVEPGGDAVHVSWERGPLNIFDTRLLRDLTEGLRSAQVREARVVVLKGEGKCWSAGFSIEDHLRPRVREMMTAFRDAVTAIRGVGAPTIGQVHSHCLGGGLELLMACDLAVGTVSSTYGQPEVKLGVFPPFGVVAYERMLGPRRARELLFLGGTVSAEEAQRMGILNRVVPDSELSSEVGRSARTLAGYRSGTLRLLKRLMREDQTSPLLKVESAYLNELMTEPGAEDSLKAFLEKRPAAARS
ncbi:MAG: enoyl-CoA hydratase/isomerase family protein [Euryarchaeota archaeon]|nr:enoyl-CoA hydratase/isomerase family protein [Euryarchaeota archaeon]MDE1835391.1 enoyl-CoA hydratase/isomerase family protein [Euryarchaeota archaeon]MDE1880494.1 enoyl-CoA hydratase/isomerase family protein [Euryarchaeota archaeon]MDE2043687.1 enoyl-CoA hydratase/isomerase family protein [Thermoplasmata archaeon]